ncbi:MAG: hypothetical protein IT393_06895 [Nitrospirae bacterium]|nr:hypothetical protein [Nitrospirota bacterium]
MKKTLLRKNYLLDIKRLKKAQKAMGTRTETETIHKALEIAASEIELAKALQNLMIRGKGKVSDVFSGR